MRVQPGQNKTHGFCKRHAHDALSGLPEEAVQQFMARWNDSYWPPDLAEHPELVGGPPTPIFAA
jgi:hypothetical protein